MAQFTEEEKTLRRIEKRFGKGVVEYGLIEEGDRILIGLSGGKDSLALVELLARRSRILKPRFSVIAVHVVKKNIPIKVMWIISEIIRSHVGYLLFCMKRSLMQVRTLVSHLVFYVLGIGGKLCLLWQRSNSATR